MTQKTIMIGLVAIAFVAGSIMTSTVAYASDHQNGTPFLQAELDAINAIVADILLDITELQNLQVLWVDVIDIPAGFADDIDNDLLADLNCSTNDIIKWNGIWECANAGDGSATTTPSAGMDCNTILFMLELEPQFDTRDGCELEDAEFDIGDFSGADLSGANLFGAVFDGGKAVGVNFSGADLRQMDFFETDILGANFSGANLDGAYFDRAINQPTGSIDCIGTPIDATFTCTG